MADIKRSSVDKVAERITKSSNGKITSEQAHRIAREQATSANNKRRERGEK